MSLFRRMMAKNRIPTPSRLMAEMLSLKIAQLPADDKYVVPLFIEMELSGGIVLEIRCGLAWQDIRDMAKFKDLSVGYAADPTYMSVVLTYEEQDIVLKQIGLLADRSRRRCEHERSVKSEQAAMTILEAIITD